MRVVSVGVAILIAGLLVVGCSNDAKPDAYWLKHSAEAQKRIGECKKNGTDLKQEIRTKPPSALSTMARECLYLVYSGDYQRDTDTSDKPASLLD